MLLVKNVTAEIIRYSMENLDSSFYICFDVRKYFELIACLHEVHLLIS